MKTFVMTIKDFNYLLNEGEDTYYNEVKIVLAPNLRDYLHQIGQDAARLKKLNEINTLGGSQ